MTQPVQFSFSAMTQREFRRWRERYRFPTEELGRHAWRVEQDKALLEKIGDAIPSITASANQHREEFERAMFGTQL